MKGLRTRTRFETEAKGANPLHAWPFRLNLGLHWEYTGTTLELQSAGTKPTEKIYTTRTKLRTIY